MRSPCSSAKRITSGESGRRYASGHTSQPQIVGVKVLLERFEKRVLMQARAAFGLEAAERAAAVAFVHEMVFAEMTMQPLEQGQLQLRDSFVIDELGVARSAELLLELRRS